MCLVAAAAGTVAKVQRSLGGNPEKKIPNPHMGANFNMGARKTSPPSKYGGKKKRKIWGQEYGGKKIDPRNMGANLPPLPPYGGSIINTGCDVVYNTSRSPWSRPSLTILTSNV